MSGIDPALEEAIENIVDWLDYDVWPAKHPELERDVKALSRAWLHYRIQAGKTTVDPQRLRKGE